MKNSPEPEWFNKLEKRLRDYIEEPDADTWNKIAAKTSHQSDPVWMPWASRSAELISALVFLWIGLNLTGPDVDLANETLKYKQSLSENESSATQADEDRAHARRESKSPTIHDVDKTYGKKNIDKAVQTERVPDAGQTDVSDLPIENEKTSTTISFPVEITHTPTTENEIARTDLLNSETIVKDSLQLTNKKPILKPRRKKRVSTLYASLSPSLSYQRITPLMNDGVVIDRFNSKHIFSADRLGVGLEAGIQTKVSSRFEFFGGLSVYQQSQMLVYQYQSGDFVNIRQEEDFDYTLTPGTLERKVKYNMLNLGAEAGMIYFLRGERLAHKIGAGLSYQHGIRQASEGETYKNSKSQYLSYQLFYRNEYTLNNSVNIFIQPFFRHGLVSKEQLAEPFKLKPYRAGFSIGVLFNFR